MAMAVAAEILVHSVAAAILLLSFAAPLQGSIQRLILDPSNTPSADEIRGITEVTVIPPFEEAKVSILVDGKVIASSSIPPYTAEIDFGVNGIEHRIGVVARSRDGKRRSEWSHVINRGNHPLTVSVRLHAAEADPYIEAICTAPKADPIVAVEFFDGANVLGTSGKPPYRITVAPGFEAPVIYATARTRSGEEETDFLTTGGDIAVESFQLRTVPIYVSVVDRNGSALSNLKRSSFRVLDNGQETRILEFAPAFNQPISIALLLDASMSMTYEMEAATKAAVRFVKGTLRPTDRLALFTIRDVPRREVPITSEWNLTDELLNALLPDGNTAIYDGIACATRELGRERYRRAIVLFTDGQDTSSIAGFDETLEIARRAGIPVYIIAYGETQSFGQELERLRLLAGETGGFLSVAASNNLHDKYEQIANDLRSQYRIRYQVGDNAKSNQWRAVKVVMNSPRLTARTIRGYFTP